MSRFQSSESPSLDVTPARPRVDRRRRAAVAAMVAAFVWSVGFVLPVQHVAAAEANLVGWWKLDGDLSDAATPTRVTTPVGSPTYVAGKDGQALVLNGTSQYATTADASASSTSRRTASLWRPGSSRGSLPTQDLICQVDDRRRHNGYSLSLATPSGSTGKVFVRINNDPPRRLHDLVPQRRQHVGPRSGDVRRHDRSTSTYNGIQEAAGSLDGFNRRQHNSPRHRCPGHHDPQRVALLQRRDGRRPDLQPRAVTPRRSQALAAIPRPRVNAGTDQTITLPATASLSGTATDDAPSSAAP